MVAIYVLENLRYGYIVLIVSPREAFALCIVPSRPRWAVEGRIKEAVLMKETKGVQIHSCVQIDVGVSRYDCALYGSQSVIDTHS